MVSTMCHVILLAGTLISRQYSAAAALIPKDGLSFFTTNRGMARPFRSSISTSATSSTIQDNQVKLSSGVFMQVLSCIPTSPAKVKKPPLVFLHGSFHGAWCWAENFMPYFAALGYPVTALSWRGTGGTFAGEGVEKVKIEEHVADLQSFLKEFVPNWMDGSSPKPVLISHSFGGLSIMKMLEIPGTLGDISGAVIMCSVPPSGNGKMTMRFLRRSLRDSWKITAGLAMKRCIRDGNLCRELFFGGVDNDHGISDDDIARFQGYFERDTVATIDLLDLAKKLPSALADENGRAPFLASSDSSISFLVIGATEDFIVDQKGNEETARYFGLDAPLVVDSPHDVMLGGKWPNAAKAIQNWLNDNKL